MGHRTNRECLLRLHGLWSITLITFVIIVACLLDETESVRETKAVKSSKSNKEKVRLSVNASMRGFNSLKNITKRQAQDVMAVLSVLSRFGTDEIPLVITHALYLTSKRKPKVIYSMKWVLFIVRDT